MDKWGCDHWSVLVYIESLCVEGMNGYGKPDHRRIQTNENRHPEFLVADSPRDGSGFGIWLRDGVVLPGPDYDGWDCLEDAEREGLIENVGTGFTPVFKMTVLGNKVVSMLRAHKTNGGSFTTFHYEDSASTLSEENPSY